MFSLVFSQSNDAFKTASETETARILRHIADRVENGCIDGPVKDDNGNRIGRWATTDDD